MRFLWTLSLTLLLSSCLKNTSGSIEEFRVGKFKTILEDNEAVSVAVRNDSIQIETYEQVTDTFLIRWLDPFEYVLQKRTRKRCWTALTFTSR